MTLLQAGTEVVISTPKIGHLRSYGSALTKTVITRVTKARIFVRAEAWKGDQKVEVEREFNRNNLVERDSSRSDYRRSKLLVEPTEIAAALERHAQNEERRALERDARRALAEISSKFLNLEFNTPDELVKLKAFAASLSATSRD